MSEKTIAKNNKITCKNLNTNVISEKQTHNKHKKNKITGIKTINNSSLVTAGLQFM